MSASYLRKYGTGTGADIYINIPKAGSANHAVSGDWTPAAGDVKISKDGGAAANIGTLPTAIAMGNSTIWKFVFTDAELQAAFISVTISDSATKAVDDTGFSIETYGNSSALHAFDLDTASTAQTGDSYAIVNSGTHGNAALKTLIDAVDDLVDTEVAAIKTVVDAILADTGTDGVIVATNNDKTGYGLADGAITAAKIAAAAFTAAKFAAGALDAAALASDAANEIRDAVWAKAMAELSAVPGATDAIFDGLMLLIMALRNKRDTEAASDEIHNDAGSVIATATVSDNGTVFTKSKYA